jgi:hypothetical protein
MKHRMAGKGRVENLRAPWKSGESGNPSGRPKRRPISDRYEAFAELELPAEWKKRLRLPAGILRHIKTLGDLQVLAQFQGALKGKTEAAREIADRIEGKATQRIEAANREGEEILIRVVYGSEP